MDRFIKTKAANTVLKKIVINGSEELKNQKKLNQKLKDDLENTQRELERYKMMVSQ